MKSRACLFLLLSTLYVFHALGQKIAFSHFANPSEIKDISINAILKDSKGFIWVGTYEGLKKFDGYEVTSYLENYDSLGNRDVRELYESPSGKLFIGTLNSGLFVYDPLNDTFQQYVHSEINTESISDNKVISIARNLKGNLVIATKKGIDIFNPENRTFTHVFSVTEKKESFIDMIEDMNHNFWLMGTNGLYLIEKELETLQVVYSYPTAIKATPGNIYCDHLLNVWFASQGTGLKRYNPRTNNTLEFENTSSVVISDIVQDKSKFIWVSTDGDGLLRYDYAANKFEPFKHNPTDKKTISSNAIHSLYIDSDGFLWLGNFKKGLDLLGDNRSNFQLINSTGEFGHRLSNESVLSLAECKNQIFIGTDGGGINILDLKSKRIDFVNQTLNARVIKSLAVQDDRYLWYGTFLNGLGKIDLSNSSLNPDTVLFEKESIWSLLYSKNKLWVGVLNKGLRIIDLKTGNIKSYPLKGYSSNDLVTILTMYEDDEDRVWVGTEKSGLFCFLNDSTFVHFKEKVFLGKTIKSITQTNDGRILFSVVGAGIVSLENFKNKEFLLLSGENELMTKNTMGIVADGYNDLWISTDKGISKYSQGSKSFVHFDEYDGLQGRLFNDGARLKTTSGLVFFGGTSGLNFFDPKNISLNREAPPIAITDFKIFNKSIQQQESPYYRKYLHSHISNTEEIEIEYTDNVFTIEFAALNYIVPQKNKYAYKLIPFDKDWHYVGANKRFANYTNLEPGNYFFRVIASNNDGKWNMNPKELKITILPSWWLTWWFKFLSIVLSVASIAFVFYIRTRNIKEQNLKLNKEVLIKTASLQEKNEILEKVNAEIKRKSDQILSQQSEIIEQKEKLEELNNTKDKLFSIVAHDLKNPVNALSLLVSILKNNYTHSEVEDTILFDIQKSTESIRFLILNLLEWAKSQSTEIKVNSKHFNLKQLIEENHDLLSLQLVQKNIRFHIHIAEDHAIYGDRDMVNTIIRNLLGNSIRYVPNNGEITISSELNGYQIYIQVEDNGPGFPEPVLQKLEQYSYAESISSGLGLTLCKEFTKLNEGEIRIQNKSNGNGAQIDLIFTGKQINETYATHQNKSLEIENTKVSFDHLIHNSFKDKTISIVEDDESLRHSMELLLGKYFNVFSANNVKDGLEIAESKEVDLVISDIILPDDNGIHLCHLIKTNEQTSHVPVILITAENSEEVHNNGLLAGADAYIKKPFQETILLSTINNLFLSQQKIRQRFSIEPQFDASEITSSTSDQKLLSNAVTFIENNLSNGQLNGDVLGKELAISKSVLYTKIKKITGQTVNEFIRTVRLKNSIPLLLKAELSIAEIAAETGFNSPSYFTKSFTDHFGVAPKAYAIEAHKQPLG